MKRKAKTGQVGRTVLPCCIRLRLDRLASGRYRMRYEEGFPDATIVKRTFDAAQIVKATLASQGLALTRPDPTTIAVAGNVSSATAGNFLTGEFLAWATLGEMRLRDLLGGVFTAAAGPTK